MANSEDKLTKARIKLQEKNPFFAYLSLFLNFEEDKEGILPSQSAGMGVTQTGKLFYKDEFVQKISEEELVSVLCHEVLHLAFLHLIRKGSKDAIGWNIACDLCVNSILKLNDYKLPCGLIPTAQDDFLIGRKLITDISKKTAEQIYSELPKELKDKREGFDEHIFGEGQSEEERTKAENEWLGRVEEAYCSAKTRGKLPLGIDRFIDELHSSKINWKALLLKSINSTLVTDGTWNKPSKKSIACGVYLPNVLKEKVEVVVAIDTSGSIGRKELTDFISEIVAIAKAYQNQVDMRLLTHDCVVQNDYEIRNGSIDKIKQIQIKGGGGTSHLCVFDYVKEKIKDCKMLLCFTDGFSDLNEFKIDEYRFQKVFLISEQGNEEQIKGNCTTIRIKNEN